MWYLSKMSLSLDEVEKLVSKFHDGYLRCNLCSLLGPRRVMDFQFLQIFLTAKSGMRNFDSFACLSWNWKSHLLHIFFFIFCVLCYDLWWTFCFVFIMLYWNYMLICLHLQQGYRFLKDTIYQFIFVYKKIRIEVNCALIFLYWKF